MCRSHCQERHWGESPTGADWLKVWEEGETLAADGDCAKYMRVRSVLRGDGSAEPSFIIATTVTRELITKMLAYRDMEGKANANWASVKMIMTQLLASWEAFLECPTRYVTELREAAGDYTAAVVRRHFVDATLVKGKKSTWVAGKDPGLVAQIIECDVLWAQQGFVEVAISESRFTADEAALHMPESWRRGAWNPLTQTGVPVDFGAFVCRGCKQFSKYKFCPHCVLCGAFLREGRWKPPPGSTSGIPVPFYFPDLRRSTAGLERRGRSGGTATQRSDRYGKATGVSPGTAQSRTEQCGGEVGRKRKATFSAQGKARLAEASFRQGKRS